jgi:hypothetical protein
MTYLKLMRQIVYWYTQHDRQRSPILTASFLLAALASVNLLSLLCIWDELVYRHFYLVRFLTRNKGLFLGVLLLLLVVHLEIARVSKMSTTTEPGEDERFPPVAKQYILVTAGVYVMAMALIFFMRQSRAS